MDFLAIHKGLATAAATVSGLRTAAKLGDTVNPPFFAPIEHEIDYQQTFGTSGMTTTVFTCGLFVSRGDTDAGQALLVEYLNPAGPTSIRAALEADRTLGGAAKQLIVSRVRGSGRLYQVAGTDYLGAMYDVTVWA
jgi:hypothetical protein